MKKFKELEPEVKFAGIFGAIAIISICFEVVLGGFSVESITAGIKDLSGTIVAVLVFIIAVKGIKTDANKKFVEYYDEKMGMLVEKYSPLLQKTKVENQENLNKRELQKANKLTKKECYDLNTNVGALYGEGHKKMALFCEITKENCKDIKFSLNYSMFGYKEKSEINQLNMQIIGQKIRCFVLNYIHTHYENSGVEKVDFIKESLDINIEFNKILKSEKDAEMLVGIIDCVLINCLILSNKEIKIIYEHKNT